MEPRPLERGNGAGDNVAEGNNLQGRLRAVGKMKGERVDFMAWVR
jgi:hypothetical protein